MRRHHPVARCPSVLLLVSHHFLHLPRGFLPPCCHPFGLTPGPPSLQALDDLLAAAGVVVATPNHHHVLAVVKAARCSLPRTFPPQDRPVDLLSHSISDSVPFLDEMHVLALFLFSGLEAPHSSELLERAPRLQDAQGERVPIKGYKNGSFVFTAEAGRTVLIREKAHFAEKISQPIISYGKLMESGWGIDGCDHALVLEQGEKEKSAYR